MTSYKVLNVLSTILFIICFIGIFLSPVLGTNGLRAVSFPFGVGLLSCALEFHFTKQVSGGRRVSDRVRAAYIVSYIIGGLFLIVWGGRFLLEALKP